MEYNNFTFNNNIYNKFLKGDEVAFCSARKKLVLQPMLESTEEGCLLFDVGVIVGFVFSRLLLGHFL